MQAGCTVLAACRTPSKATELQQLAKEHPGQLHLLTLDVTDEKSVEVQDSLCSGCARQWCLQDPSSAHQMQTDLRPAMPVQAAAAEAAKLCPHGIDVLINNAGGLRSGNALGLLHCGNSSGLKNISDATD